MLPGMSDSRLEIIGQRGSGGQAPSGTEPAIQAALRTGVTGLELEVQFAADAVPIVCFERTLERLAGVKGTIRNQTARELAGYDVGFRFGDRYRGLRLVTVEEAADMVPPGFDLHLEIKDLEPVNAKHIRGLMGVLRAHGGVQRCLITSRSEAILASVATTDPEVRRGLRTSGTSAQDPEKAAALGCRSLHPEAAATRRELVDACHERGLRVYPTSANDTRSIRALVDIGVDGVGTDQPERVADALRGGGESRHHEPPRREPFPERMEEEGHPGTPPPPAAVTTSTHLEDASQRPRGRRRRRPGPRRHEDRPVAAPAPGSTAPAPMTAPPAEKAPPAHAEGLPAVAPEAVTGERPVDGAGTARRRRGRRGGRREQARRARRAAVQGGPAADTGEPILLEPVEDSAEPLELLGEIHAELSGEGDRPASGAPPARAGQAPRRRRGRRGGKRAQARRQRGDQGGSDPAS